MRVIDLVNKECNKIINEMFKSKSKKPYIVISENREKGYILTLVTSDRTTDYECRQSEFITLNTDLSKTIELLFNRTL